MALDQNTLILVGGAILIAYILIQITQKIAKFIGVCIVLALGYYFWQGGTVDGLKDMGVEALFKQKDLSRLTEEYCGGEQAASLKCECIVQPVYADLTSRLNASDFAKLAENEDLRVEELRKSMKNKQKEIRDCIVKNKGAAYWDGLKGKLEELKIEQPNK